MTAGSFLAEGPSYQFWHFDVKTTRKGNYFWFKLEISN